jgi:hypothetical protein
LKWKHLATQKLKEYKPKKKVQQSLLSVAIEPGIRKTSNMGKF